MFSSALPKLPETGGGKITQDALGEVLGRYVGGVGRNKSQFIATPCLETTAFGCRRLERIAVAGRADLDRTSLGPSIRNPTGGHGNGAEENDAQAGAANGPCTLPAGGHPPRGLPACALATSAPARPPLPRPLFNSPRRRPFPVPAPPAARSRRWCSRSPPRTSRAPIRLTWSRRSRSAFPASPPTTSRATNLPRTYATAALRLRRCKARRKGSPSTCKASASMKPSATPSTGT